MVIHALWRSGGTTILWAMRYCYDIQIIYEPFMGVDGRIPQEILSKSYKSIGLSHEEEFRSWGQSIRLVDQSNMQCTGKVLSFLDQVCKTLSHAKAMKILGMINYANHMTGMSPQISLVRDFSGYYDASISKRATSPGAIFKHCPGLTDAQNRPDAVNKAVQCMVGLPSDIVNILLPWITHAYYAIFYDEQNIVKMFNVNRIGQDPSDISDYIRFFMGKEKHGVLEHEVEMPKNWVYPGVNKKFDWFDDCGGWFGDPAVTGVNFLHWWKPPAFQEEIANRHKPAMENIRDRLSQCDDETIQRVVEYIK